MAWSGGHWNSAAEGWSRSGGMNGGRSLLDASCGGGRRARCRAHRSSRCWARGRARERRLAGVWAAPGLVRQPSRLAGLRPHPQGRPLAHPQVGAFGCIRMRCRMVDSGRLLLMSHTATGSGAQLRAHAARGGAAARAAHAGGGRGSQRALARGRRARAQAVTAIFPSRVPTQNPLAYPAHASPESESLLWACGWSVSMRSASAACRPWRRASARGRALREARPRFPRGDPQAGGAAEGAPAEGPPRALEQPHLRQAARPRERHRGAGALRSAGPFISKEASCVGSRRLGGELALHQAR